MSIEDLIDDFFARSENVQELESLDDSYQDVDETVHEVDHRYSDYNVRKRQSGKIETLETINIIRVMHQTLAIPALIILQGRGALVVEPISMSSMALDAIESDDELHSGEYLLSYVHIWLRCKKFKHKLGQNRDSWIS